MCSVLRSGCPPHISFFFFFNDTATTEIYTLSLHDALPISTAGVAVETRHLQRRQRLRRRDGVVAAGASECRGAGDDHGENEWAKRRWHRMRLSTRGGTCRRDRW